MLIDGNKIASEMAERLKIAIAKRARRKPALAFLLVGNHPASQSYIRMKKKRCEEVGIESIDHIFPENFTEKALLKEIKKLNQSAHVDGILVQLPLPKQIDTNRIISAIDPAKDVDGFHPNNMGKLLLGQTDGFFSCTPYGIVKLLEAYSIKTTGKHVVILGRSNIVGKPLAAMLVQKEGPNATVTIAHSASENLPLLCRQADILVAAMGAPQFVKADMVKEGVVVIDVGINRMNGKIVGDVDFSQVAPKASWITPVPKGVGPMTIAMLLENTWKSYLRCN